MNWRCGGGVLGCHRLNMANLQSFFVAKKNIVTFERKKWRVGTGVRICHTLFIRYLWEMVSFCCLVSMTSHQISSRWKWCFVSFSDLVIYESVPDEHLNFDVIPSGNRTRSDTKDRDYSKNFSIFRLNKPARPGGWLPVARLPTSFLGAVPTI